jgi:hypothetical protein
MLKSVRFIPLETTDESLIGGIFGIRKIKKINNKYYISSNFRDLLEFDENGLFIKRIGKTGIGPGEYVELGDFDVFENGHILVSSANRLIFYDKEGKYLHSIMLDFMIWNIKIVKNNRILIFSTGAEYAFYEIDLSGKIINKEFKSNNATRIGHSISFVTYGQDKTITKIGHSNDCIFYHFNDKNFSYTKLLCDNGVLDTVREEELQQAYNGKYNDVYGNISEKAIYSVAGSNSHLCFIYGYGCFDEDKKVIQVLNIENRNIEHIISRQDIDDVTFTDKPYFMLGAFASDAQDCFLTYMHPFDLLDGLKKHSEFEDNPNYKKLKELFMNKSEDVIAEENPILVEFVFK